MRGSCIAVMRLMSLRESKQDSTGWIGFMGADERCDSYVRPFQDVELGADLPPSGSNQRWMKCVLPYFPHSPFEKLQQMLAGHLSCRISIAEL